MTQATRPRVYEAIDSERAYQEALKKTANAPAHEVDAFVLFMDGYMGQVKHTAAFDWSPGAKERTLAGIRKVVALGVACMEAHGAPMREMPDAAGLTNRVNTAQ